MKKFSSLVLSVIDSLNKNYEAARNDLFEIVADIEFNMKEILPDFTIGLTTLEDSTEGTFYRLVATPAPNDHVVGNIRITDIFIPASGYPISSGRFILNSDNYNPDIEFRTKNDIDIFFQDLLTKPESRLIQAIGFAMRRKKAQLDNDIPF